MPTLESVNPAVLYCMFKGEPGTRKSTQALSFPKPQYWFSWDRKMSGIIVPARNWGVDMKLIDYDDYDNWDKARVKLEKLQTNCPYKTIVIDSITSCADMALRQTRLGNLKGKKIGTISVDGFEEFNAEAASLNELIALTKDIHIYHKVNIILIAHVIQAEYKDKNQETYISRTIVTAGKRIAPKIPAYCGEVYHFDMVKANSVTGNSGGYKILTVHTGDDFARTSIDLPREIQFNDDPLYDKYLLPAIKELRG